MSLHGPIKVNDVEVGYWSAQRVETADVNLYHCTVDWTPEGFTRWNGRTYPYWSGKRTCDGARLYEHAQRHTFTIRHRYEDGAVALAAKVLAHAIPSRSATE